jgi:hypothetical protein
VADAAAGPGEARVDPLMGNSDSSCETAWMILL